MMTVSIEIREKIKEKVEELFNLPPKYVKEIVLETAIENYRLRRDVDRMRIRLLQLDPTWDWNNPN